MKKIKFLSLMLVTICLLISLNQTLQAQIMVDTSFTITELVNDFFNTEDNCVAVSNISFTGMPEQKAFFDEAGTGFGINNGIFLATGKVGNLAQSNALSGASDNFIGENGDADLEILIGDSTNDAAALEFDIVPETDTIVFTYIFASEEYLEFVGTGYNDVFAFFISGPGIEGLQNIATIPGTDLPVSINNVNDDDWSEYYVNNPIGSNVVEFDGYTTPLEATAVLTPFETYHVKIVVADVLDGILDSGVFLGIQSLCGDEVLTVKSDFAWEVLSENDDMVTVSFQSITNYSNCEILWSFGDNYLNTLSNPVHYYMEAGTYEVEMTASKYGVTNKFSRTITVGNPVGIEENTTISFDIFPNPAHDFITLSLNNQSQNQPTQIRLLDVQGQVQYQQNLASGVSNTIDISGLEEGIYLIQVQTDEEVVTKKWMKF